MSMYIQKDPSAPPFAVDERTPIATTAPQLVQYQVPPHNSYTADQSLPQDREVRRSDWSSGICQWHSNIFPSCWCVCCCFHGIYLLAQMGRKVGYSAFCTPICVYVLLLLLSIILFSASTDDEGTIMLLPFLCALIYSIGLRLHIKRTDGIGEDNCCSRCGECCTGFWCFWCSVTQMARHVYGYRKVLDGDSDIDRGDSYESSELAQMNV